MNYRNNLFIITINKKDQGTQTEECVALNIGDKILSQAQLTQPLSGCKASASSQAWWQQLLKWN